MRHCVLLLLFVPALARAGEKPLVFEHVTVIDATGAPARPDMTLTVADGRITALGKTGTVPLPKDAEVVDATGKFVIPGLWDMHAHLASTEFLSLCVANGVTGVREMHAFVPSLVFYWRQQTAAGKLLGPHIVAAGAMVDGPKPRWPAAVTATNEQEGREAVRSLKKRGADFIKVYDKLPRTAYFGIAHEAKKEGVPFAGHVPVAVSAAEASDAGQKSIEHLTGVLLACAGNEGDLRKEVGEQWNVRLQVKALAGYREDKAQALFARFAKNGTWQCPTLTVLRALAFLDDKELTHDDRVKYITPYLRNMLYPKGKVAGPEEFADRKKVFKKYLAVVGTMQKAGVPLLAGTDTPNPYCFPGFSLHDELGLLVEAGLLPMEALQAATRNPARYLGRSKESGTVEARKIADLVLLDANPLEDIGNTRRIAAVVVGGKLLRRADLRAVLEKVEAANRK
jgi:imidazolonepropionase-like amidohydrolase